MITWLIVGICLLISFVFSGIEAGILSVNRVRIRHRARTGDPAALTLQTLLQAPERLLMTVVIVTNLMNIFAVTLTTQVFVRWWGSYGYAISLLVFFPLYLFALELFPKSLFRRFSTKLLALLAAPLRLADRILSPFLHLGTRLVRRFSPGEAAFNGKLFTGREDFKYFMLENEKSGGITPVQRELIQNVVDFRALLARDLMRPLADFPCQRYESNISDLIAASDHGHLETFLIVSESGEIMGVADLFDILLDRDHRTHLSSHTRALPRVSATEGAPRILRKLSASHTKMALVMDGNKPVGLIFRETLYKRMISPT